MFKITDYIEFNQQGRAKCPVCGEGKRGKTLSLVPDTDGAYKCFRGCTPEDIRASLGAPKDRPAPATQHYPPEPIKSITVTPAKVREAHEKLLGSNGPARRWLERRGITEEHIKQFKLGIARSKVGDRHVPSISIPIPANAEGTAYYQKKRVAPWDEEVCNLPDYKPWSQYGIPARVYFTHKPDGAQETWLCEGEWDAITLGYLAHREGLNVAIATFTCGAGNVPAGEELARLPGQVKVFYDWNDKPLPDGTKPGENGAKKVAQALGDRAKIATVPHPEDCQVQGWDVSDAINSYDYTLDDFRAAAARAIAPVNEASQTDNPLRSRLQWNDDLLDTAPDYTEWLVPDLLTSNELFLLAAGPRAGKSLLAMTLAHAVASGGLFMERPVTQGTVIYVRCEDGPSKTKEREEKQGWSRGLPVAWLSKFKLSEMDHLRELARDLDPRLIVLDTLSRVKDGNISESSAEMSQVLEPLQELADELDCCILLVHHTGKVSVDNADKLDIFDTIRGSSAIRAVCRGTMIIAAAERDYRLLVENGWGKHDLRVVLDANTLTWRLLGHWNPPEGDDQRAQIVAYLKKVQCATLEQIHEATAIPKKSLYTVLSRLQTSETAEEKVVKEGGRRSYTYRLAIFNTIQQLNSLLNSPNPDTASDRPAIQQKITFSTEGNQAKSDHLPDFVVSPLQTDDHFSKSDHLLNRGDHPSETLQQKDSSHDDHFLPKNPDALSVEYGHSQGSKADVERDTPIQQVFNSYSTVEYTPEEKSAVVVRSDDHPPEKSDQSPPKRVQKASQGDHFREVRAGVKVFYRGKTPLLQRVCGRRQLEVVSVEEGSAVVRHKDWLVTQSIPLDDLSLA